MVLTSEASVGTKVGSSAGNITMDEIAETFINVLGDPVDNNKFVTTEIFSTCGFPDCEDLSKMFIFMSVLEVNDAKKFYTGELISFEEYVKSNKAELRHSTMQRYASDCGRHCLELLVIAPPTCGFST